MWKFLKRMHLIQTGSLPKVHHITAASLSAITTPTPFPMLHQAGVGGSAAARLQEAKQRARLLKELDEASKRVSHSITELQRKYGDVLLYKVGGAGQQGFQWRTTVVVRMNYCFSVLFVLQMIILIQLLFFQQGGPYLEKMCRDHTEMLYCLQQERRHDVLRVATQQLAVK